MGKARAYLVLNMTVAGLMSVSALSVVDAAASLAAVAFLRQSLRLTKSVARCEALPPSRGKSKCLQEAFSVRAQGFDMAHAEDSVGSYLNTEAYNQPSKSVLVVTTGSQASGQCLGDCDD